MEISIEPLPSKPISSQPLEIVERKGIGHPDTICDSIVERVSIELCKHYLREVGTVLHYNVDKALLAAGEVECKFGGGVVKRPMLLVVGDRATFAAGKLNFPVEEIVVSTAKDWFKEHLRFVDPEQHVRYQIELKPGSAALRDIFECKQALLGANDTSAAVGYAPLSPTELLVLEVERMLNSKQFKREFPETGEDVKVMGVRMKEEVDLTIAMAFVDRFIDSEQTYFKRKKEVVERIERSLSVEGLKVNTHLNVLDRAGRGIGGLYLTVLGTCADGADCGEVGRGNRVNGLIPLNRPSTSEAAAGKNPVSHVGKIYNVLAFCLAEKIQQQLELEEVYVWLVSQIGRSIAQPFKAAVQLWPAEKAKSCALDVQRIVESELERMEEFCKELGLGKFSVC